MLNKKYYVGIDVGASKMACVLLDQNYKIIADSKLATPKDNLSHFIIMLKALLEPLQEKAKTDNAEIESIGIGLPGTIDYKNEKILIAQNLPIINNIKLLEELRTQLQINIPMKMDNDVNCFTRAEALLGAGKGSDNVYGLTIGTGIGGGWWHNKQIYNGAHGGAGEICDTVIDLENKITLEQAYRKLTQNNPKLLAQEAYEGDLLAGKSFEELGSYLGMAFANLVNILDPEIIVIGGGTMASGDLFLKTAKKIMTKFVANPEAKKTKLVKSKLGESAGAIGAALLSS